MYLDPDGPENDEVDGCELDFAADPNDEDTGALLALFPDSVPTDEWEGVFDGS